MVDGTHAELRKYLYCIPSQRYGLDFSRPHIIPQRVLRCRGIVRRGCEAAFRGYGSLACKVAETGGCTFQIYHSIEKLTRALLRTMSSKVSTTEYEHFFCAEDGGKFVVQVVRELAADFEFAVVINLHRMTRISLGFNIQTLANFAGSARVNTYFGMRIRNTRT